MRRSYNRKEKAIMSVVPWYGGKAGMAKRIINIFPPHRRYVEVFGGGGSVLLQKHLSPVEIYNDLNKGLVTLFSVLRDPVKAEKLRDQLQLTPFAREEWKNCNEGWENEEDEIERARKFYVACVQSFSANFQSWKITPNNPGKGLAPAIKRYLNAIDKNLLEVVPRLRQVQIENLSFEKLIEKYDSEDTLFYLDPPYIHDTRGESARSVYKHELEDTMHHQLVDILLNIKGKAIMSGYDHPIYDPLTTGKWSKKKLGDIAKTCMSSKDGEKKDRGEEYLWINFKIGEI